MRIRYIRIYVDLFKFRSFSSNFINKIKKVIQVKRQIVMNRD